MSNFYIGQEVVCVKELITVTIWGQPLKKGKHYIIKGLKLCDCGKLIIDVGINTELNRSECNDCGCLIYGAWWISEDKFAPLETIPESHEKEIEKLIEESLKVSV